MSNEPTYEEYVDRIHYSEKYADDKWEYRHVILPKPFLKRIPKSYFDPEEPGVLRILSDAEWRGIGITQSLGWEHYEVHAPEPHILLFRREKDYQAKYGPQGKPSDAAKIKNDASQAHHVLHGN
ncbi:cyclin-dependent kinase regulatory subunit CKS1 [Malassezia restricta]|uniref:Cyclin-dependent kinases regulatory subunit n=1 Tax=Malassezia restricta (strain ATCC 96810 / NBRC 103918 / CBS 7877) TaxID=425264 RepID=A0A3G2S8E6_MALR7|nr:cyclin-dependent kinase regulatory subunit CKS1 [Malassezia restricta]AXA51566.1 cyclin-dependent kinase regulatory subunit CKS1 [Malassezia restricta]AYO44333.1 Cyclin-dependent kinases regulatory subunit [Malassezia restricta CBS 7877]